MGRRSGSILAIQVRAGIGKTSLVEAACRWAQELDYEVLRARGSELEAGFAFGVVRQLFERRLADAEAAERATLLVGPAAAARPLLLGIAVETPAGDKSFAALHGLYWLAANLSAAPLLIAVDDAHWADEPSLRWLAYLAPRLEGLAAGGCWLRFGRTIRRRGGVAAGGSRRSAGGVAPGVVEPKRRQRAGARRWAAVQRCVVQGGVTAGGGNPLYLTELLRAVELDGPPLAALSPGKLLSRSRGDRAGGHRSRWAASVRWRSSGAGLRCAWGRLRAAPRGATAAGGDGCATRLAEGLVRWRSLPQGTGRGSFTGSSAPLFEASLTGASEIRPIGARPGCCTPMGPLGQVAAHLAGVRPAAMAWVLARLGEAARAAMEGGAPQAAADLLGRALAEPPPPAQRSVCCGRRHTRRQLCARDSAVQLEEALQLVTVRASGLRSRSRSPRPTRLCSVGWTR